MQPSLISTNFFFKKQKDFYRGKVRDVYNINDRYLVVVACDRISAFDHVLPKPIPFKGQVLNQMAAQFLDATSDIIPNWKIATPDPNVTIGYRCEPFPIEIVIRGYLAGHAWREYKEGKREICGVRMPDGLRENDPFPEPIITPTIKATSGHDTDISMDDIVKQKLVKKKDLEKIEKYTRELYKRGVEIAAERNLILVDTKYEFGKLDDKIYLIDEVHTPDSSRYFYKQDYEERQQKGLSPRQLSKEFLRQWLIDNNFQGLKDQIIPEMKDEFVNSVSDRYIELFEKITGKEFKKRDYHEIFTSIEKNVNDYFTESNLI